MSASDYRNATVDLLKESSGKLLPQADTLISQAQVTAILALSSSIDALAAAVKEERTAS